MLVSDIKKYIKERKAASITELVLQFDENRDSLDGPLKLLIDKGLIEIENSANIGAGYNKCSGCPMTCNPKDIDLCMPSAGFNIYRWIGD